MISYNLYNRIIDILYDYTKRHIYLDGPAIEKIVELFTDEFLLEDYIKKINYVNSNNQIIRSCGYNFNNKTVFFNYDDILTRFIKKVDTSKDYKNFFEKTFKVNLNILNCALHEIFHAVEYKKVVEGQENLEKILLRISFEKNLIKEKLDSKNAKEYFDSLDMLYKTHIRFYSSTPSEHMANILATDLECKIANNPILKISISLRKSEKLKLLKAQIRDYDFDGGINSPTMNYLSMKQDVMRFKNFVSPIYNVEEVKDIIKEQSNNLCLNEKLYYGLELNRKEKSKIIKKANL